MRRPLDRPHASSWPRTQAGTSRSGKRRCTKSRAGPALAKRAEWELVGSSPVCGAGLVLAGGKAQACHASIALQPKVSA